MIIELNENEICFLVDALKFIDAQYNLNKWRCDPKDGTDDFIMEILIKLGGKIEHNIGLKDCADMLQHDRQPGA